MFQAKTVPVRVCVLVGWVLLLDFLCSPGSFLPAGTDQGGQGRRARLCAALSGGPEQMERESLQSHWEELQLCLRTTLAVVRLAPESLLQPLAVLESSGRRGAVGALPCAHPAGQGLLLAPAEEALIKEQLPHRPALTRWGRRLDALLASFFPAPFLCTRLQRVQLLQRMNFSNGHFCNCTFSTR